MSFEILNFIFASISGILLESWEIFLEAAPFLIFGLGIAGLLNIMVPDQKIMDYLGAPAGKVRSVLNASLAGLPLPLCSCGVVPAAMSIRKRGANRGATLSFLISTPETGLDSIAITYALLDPVMAVFRPLATLATAVLAGLADNFLIGEEPKKKESSIQENPGKKAGVLAVSTLLGTSVQEKSCSLPSCSCNRAADSHSNKVQPLKTTVKIIDPKHADIKPLELISKSVENIPRVSMASPALQKTISSCGCGSCGYEGEDAKISGKDKKPVQKQFFKGIKYAYIELLGDISKWMLIGILLAGIISYAIPENLIQNYLGGGIGSMLVMLLVGIPLYICATASTPLAASLVAKGMSPGTAFVFLLAGPATNAATITMVARFLGKRSAVLYVGVISICALGAGILLDWLYLKLGISATATLGTAKELIPEDLKVALAVLLLPLMLYGICCREKGCSCPECH